MLVALLVALVFGSISFNYLRLVNSDNSTSNSKKDQFGSAANSSNVKMPKNLTSSAALLFSCDDNDNNLPIRAPSFMIVSSFS